MTNDFPIPSFLQNRSVDEIHREMLDIIPDDNDKSQGQHAWNYTRPTALEAAYFCQMILPEAIRLIFPQYSYGEYLDLHAETIGFYRKKAQAAVGFLDITGKAGTVIPSGSVFSTARVNDSPSIDFTTTEDAVIPDEGLVSVPIQAVETGLIGNVLAESIILKATRLDGITSVTNPLPITGGTEDESDESLKTRIKAYQQSQEYSFVGSPADYKRWAESVDGTGTAVIIPAADLTATVTIILTDQNGTPASSQLCRRVYDHIMSPDEPLLRLAPVGAALSVVPPEASVLEITAVVKLTGTHSLEAIEQAFVYELQNNLSAIADDGEIIYTRIAAVLSRVPGVADYKNLLLDGGSDNIPITVWQLPTIDGDAVHLTAEE